MSTATEKLNEALKDLAAAEQRVKEAKRQLEQPKITENQIQPGARFWHEKEAQNVTVLPLEFTKDKYGLGGLNGPFSMFSNGPFTKEQLATYLTNRGYVQTPGRWVWQD